MSRSSCTVWRCDRCLAESPGAETHPPELWRIVDDGSRQIDVCPTCAASFDAWAHGDDEKARREERRAAAERACKALLPCDWTAVREAIMGDHG